MHQVQRIKVFIEKYFSLCFTFVFWFRTDWGKKPIVCPFCNGRGLETLKEDTIVVQSTCRMCNGSGMYIRDKCTECAGTGLLIIQRTFDLPVPSGTEDGQTMRVEVEGNEVFITFRVTESSYFRREGQDIHSDATISLSQALLGGTIKIEGIYCDEEIKIKRGTDSHQVIRLRGKGLKHKDFLNKQGDHLVHIKIKIPK